MHATASRQESEPTQRGHGNLERIYSMTDWWARLERT